MGIKVSILGATGNVGREFLSIIEERKFPVEELFLLASHKSEGKKILFGKKEIKVLDLNKFDFKKCELVFSSAGSKVASEFGPKAANSGCFVIDNSSYFRMDPDVPLVVPEVNSQDLKIIKKGFESRDKKKLREVINIIDRSGAIAEVEKEINKYTIKCLNILEMFPTSVYKESLKKMVNTLKKRAK